MNPDNPRSMPYDQQAAIANTGAQLKGLPIEGIEVSGYTTGNNNLSPPIRGVRVSSALSPDPFTLATERILLALILSAGKSRVAGDERLAKAMARAAELLMDDGEKAVEGVMK